MWKQGIIVAFAVVGSTTAVVQGCAGSSSSGERVGATSQAYDTATDLISPASCTLKNGRLISCAIAARTLHGLELETAVPLRTVVKTRKTGNCSTQFPLEVTIETAGETPVKFPYLQLAQTVVRRRDGQPITQFSLRDSSPWTSKVSLDQSCAIGIDIVSNEPDVNSKAEAQAIIAQLQQDLTGKTAVRDRYQELTLFHRAFQFLHAVAENFRTELTNETIQALRTGALDAVDTLAKLSSDCSGTTDADQANLFLLMTSLPQLGAADQWRNADGSTKTLADLVGGRAQQVLETVERLAVTRETDAGSDYDQAYRQAAADVVRADAQLARARAQLATWLVP